MTAPFRTSYARAVAGYDAEHERELVAAITTAIAESSVTTSPPVLCIRTAEAASALVTCLAAVLAMSPAATRSPTAIRRTLDELGKRLRRRIAAAERNGKLQELVRRSIRGNDVGGRA
jgi:hypothetical protein